MRNYTVQTGDTLEGISIKFLYRSALAYKIRQINNLPDNSVYPGQSLLIPDVQEREVREYAGMKIIIEDHELVQTPPITIQTAINTLAPGATFDLPIAPEFDFIKRNGFEKVVIYFDNVVILNGYISRTIRKVKNGNKTMTVDVFGQAQKLSQVNLPVSAYPRTFYNVTLEKIFKKILDIFGISLTIDEDAKSLAKEKFLKVEIGVEEKISDFLIELARQKNLIVYGDGAGGIVLKKEYVETENVLKLENYPGTVEYNSDEIFSNYTCLKNANSSGGSQTARGKIKINEFRPKVLTHNKLQDETLKNRIDYQIKTDLMNSFKCSIDLPYVTDINGDLITINKQIYFKNDDLLIPGEDFLITSTTHEFLETGRQMSMDIVPVNFLKGKYE